MDVSTRNLTTHDVLTTLVDSEEEKTGDGSEKDCKTPTQQKSSSSPASKIIKPNAFYGNSIANEAKVIRINKIIRLPVNSKVKTRLFSDLKPKPILKRRLDSVNSNKTKRRKEIFTGVCHSLKPEKRKRSLTDLDASETLTKSIRAQAKRMKTNKKLATDDLDDVFDLYKIATNKRKEKDSPYSAFKFTKPDRMCLENGSTSQRRIVKSTVLSPGRVYLDEFPKKRKLLNPKDTFLLDDSNAVNASDILDLIEDGKEIETEQNEFNGAIDDIILNLDDDVTKTGSENLDDEICSISDNELDLSNLSLSDFPETTKGILQEWNRTTPKRQSPTNVMKMATPTKRKSRIPWKENLENTPELKLFPVFEKRLLNNINASNINEQNSGAKWRAMGNDQYQIDAGQKRFGATQCSTCGVVYQLGDPDDERDHEKYHRNHKVFRHNGWSHENVVGQYGFDRVILVTKDNKGWWNKTLSVLKVVDEELGYTTEDERVLTGLKVYLYIDNKQITGCLVATQISHASKIMSDESGIDLMSDESYPVKCGISRLWTHPVHRRKGIASRLVDTMRKSFFYGYCLNMNEFAFSAPTQDGKEFAVKYTKIPNYLIYTGW